METSTPRSVILTFMFFILLFLGWFIYGSIGSYKALISYGWSTTNGTVVSAEVIKPTGKSNKYIAEISYAYKVGGKEYHANNFKATPARGTSEWVKNIVNQHPINSSVMVHYNPDKPEDSVLEPGIQSDNLFMTLVPFLIILVLSRFLKKQISTGKTTHV